MPSDTLIDELRDRVKTAAHSETNVFGPGIWKHHVVRVVENAQQLAVELDADYDTVTIAALLHDYASLIDPDYIDEHHHHSARIAEEIIRGRITETRLATVKRCIKAHRASCGPDPVTPAAHCVASGDGMAHIHAVPSLLHAAYVTREMTVEDGAGWVRTKLERSWEKLHPVAADAVRDEYHAALTVLDSNRTFDGSSAVAFRDH
ncbi:HD domain-containing protein [Halorubrum rutilum]|uniref:HD domain-containing protein n=1 Tax=Halorubrum rutilum TaxID=1364933 RepID=A0ABD6APK8_9EURY|nr:HD domain-containing protein [Halorubrum rutilum]